MKIERTCHHQFSKAACVALLLSRKTAGTQRIELTCQQFAGRAALAKQRFQFAPDRCGGLHAHLLPDNGAEQGCIATRTDSWLRIRSEEHTSELQSLMRISYAGFCLKKKKQAR